MRLITSVAAAILLLAVPALAETSVGVTAAVNPSATGTVGSAVRTISLGDNVVYSERIQTGGEGLVQILLADGTTFMVGPNSDLVIDSFVYDPNAGTAAVTATFTKGVLRFIGGQASKNGGNVTLNTPVGTMGIRGAMVDVVLDPPAGTPPHIDMLFGNEVTLEQGQALLGRLYAAGYSLVLGPNGTFEAMKTPPGWSTQIQQALAGKLGTKGGAPKGPSEGDVGESQVAKNNNPEDGPGLTQDEIDALLAAAAQYDELRNFILNNQTPQGFVGGTLSENYEGYPGEGVGLNTGFGFEFEVDNFPVLASYSPSMAQFAFDELGNPIAIEATFLATQNDCELEDCTISIVYDGDGAEGQLLVTLPDGQEVPVETYDDFLYAHDSDDPENPMNAPYYDEGNPEIQTLADTLECSECSEFIKWGFWGFSVDDVEVGDVDGGASFMGTYISGNLTTAAQLNTLAAEAGDPDAIAYYYGDAVGVVHSRTQEGGYESYVATGELVMDWKFVRRSGTVEITNFDPDNIGLNAAYAVNSPGGATGFGGVLVDHNFGGEAYVSGTAQGAFVNNGEIAAGGVIGSWDFNAFDSLSQYSVGGVFMGERTD